MRKILLFGKNGQLGWELQRCLPTLGSVVGVDQDDFDLVDSQKLRAFIRQQKPELIVNAAAYTAVDRAEEQPEVALAVNAQAPQVMAEEARELRCLLVHYSTDYVFDGKAQIPYLETDQPHPINAYGRSKLEGEWAIQAVEVPFLIFRTSWVYSLRGKGFVQSILRLAEARHTLRVVTDQVGSPTWARMLAEATTQILAKAGSDLISFAEASSGIYHLAGSGAASRFEWAKLLVELAGRADASYSAELIPARSEEFPAKAERPPYSALNVQRFTETFGVRFPPWQEALSLAIEDL